MSPLLALPLLVLSAAARVDSVQLSDTGASTAVRIDWTGTPALVAVHREGNEARVSMTDAELGVLFSGGSRYEFRTATAPDPAASAPFEGIRIESQASEVFFYFKVASDTPVEVQRGTDYMIVSFREGVPGGVVLSERPGVPARTAALMLPQTLGAARPAQSARPAPAPVPAPAPAPPPAAVTPSPASPERAASAPPVATAPPPPPAPSTGPSTYTPLAPPSAAPPPEAPAPAPAPVPPAPEPIAPTAEATPPAAAAAPAPEAATTAPAPSVDTADLYKRIFPVPTAEPEPEVLEAGTPSSDLYSKLFPYTPEAATVAPAPAPELNAAPEELAPGLHLGSLNLRPGVSTSFVDATANFLPTPTPVNDQYIELQPRIAGDTPLGSGRLAFQYEPTIRFLGDYPATQSTTHPAEVTFDSPLGERGRLKLKDEFISGVLETTQVDPGGEYFFGLGRFNKNEVGGTASIEVGPRFTLELGGGYDYVHFTEPSSFFDYTRAYGSAGIGFEATPTLKAILSYDYDTVPHQEDRPEAESHANSITGTLIGDVAPLLRGSLTVGYRDLKSPFAAPGGQHFQGLTASGTLTRDFGHESAVTILLNRSTPLSNFQDNGFYVTTSVSASLIAPLPWHVALNGGAGYHWNDYPTFVTDTDIKREDRLFGWFVGLKRPLDRRSSLFLGYRREQRRSNVEGFDSNTDGFLFQLDVDIFGRGHK